MKLESIVIVGQRTTVNLLRNFVHTARHILGICLLKVIT